MQGNHLFRTPCHTFYLYLPIIDSSPLVTAKFTCKSRATKPVSIIPPITNFAMIISTEFCPQATRLAAPLLFNLIQLTQFLNRGTTKPYHLVLPRVANQKTSSHLNFLFVGDNFQFTFVRILEYSYSILKFPELYHFHKTPLYLQFSLNRITLQQLSL